VSEFTTPTILATTDFSKLTIFSPIIALVDTFTVDENDTLSKIGSEELLDSCTAITLETSGLLREISLS
jgi:hypothetical protein